MSLIHSFALLPVSYLLLFEPLVIVTCFCEEFGAIHHLFLSEEAG